MRIRSTKRDEVEAAKRREAPAALRARADACREAPLGFRAALASGPRPRVVAELKRRSPSRGEIRPDFDPVGCAKAYADAGAAAISVLTDARYFGGELSLLATVRREVALPLLRKDFLVDAYQVDEARVAGADAVLLIARALDVAQLRALRERAAALGLDALVEVHDASDVDAALAAGADLVGINNRDLATFTTDLATTERLAARLIAAGVVVVAESGILSREDIRRMDDLGVDAVLVGEALMTSADPGGEIRALLGTAV